MNTVHDHIDTFVPAGEFKQRCLALLDQVAESRESIVVTKRGRPVARLVPYDAMSEGLRGSLRAIAEDEALFSTGEVWETDEPA